MSSWPVLGDSPAYDLAGCGDPGSSCGSLAVVVSAAGELAQASPNMRQSEIKRARNAPRAVPPAERIQKPMDLDLDLDILLYYTGIRIWIRIRIWIICNNSAMKNPPSWLLTSLAHILYHYL